MSTMNEWVEVDDEHPPLLPQGAMRLTITLIDGLRMRRWDGVRWIDPQTRRQPRGVVTHYMDITLPNGYSQT